MDAQDIKLAFTAFELGFKLAETGDNWQTAQAKFASVMGQPKPEFGPMGTPVKKD
jgi:hypothetical protein